MFVFVSFVAIVTTVVQLCVPDVYKTDGLYVASESESRSGYVYTAGHSGSFAGINLDQTSNERLTTGQEVLQSLNFLEEFLNGHDLLVALIAATRWNRKSECIYKSVGTPGKRIWGAGAF